MSVKEIIGTGGFVSRLRGAVCLFWNCLMKEISLVILDAPQWVGLVGLVVCSLVGKDYLLVLRGLIFVERRSAIFRYMNRKILQKARGVVVISEYMKRAMHEELDRLESVTVIPCPFLIDPMPTERSVEKMVLTVTGFHFRQKVEKLFAIFPAMDRLLDMYTDHLWMICGGGPLLVEAARSRAKCRNASRIVLAGHCSDVQSFYRRARIFLYFTGLDTFGLVVNEAFLAGLPVIANSDASMPELIKDGVDGRLIDMNDPNWESDFIDALGKLLDDDVLVQEWGKAGRAKVLDRFSPESVGCQFRKLLNDLKIGDL